MVAMSWSVQFRDRPARQVQNVLLPGAHPALAYSRGDKVEVWSKSAADWLRGEVEAVFVEPASFDGFDVPANFVKVSTAAGVKWVSPEKVGSELRKASGWSSSKSSDTSSKSTSSGSGPVLLPSKSTRSPPPSPVHAGGDTAGGPVLMKLVLCRNGCCRPVQPGLSRGMKPYDTCCKRCAQDPEGDQHDVNCGLRRHPEPPPAAAHRSARHLLQDEQTFRQSIQVLFDAVSGGRERLDREQVQQGLVLILGNLGMRQEELAASYVRHLLLLHLGAEDLDSLGVAEFTTLCWSILQDRRARWFPPSLPLSTRNFVKRNPGAVKRVYELGPKMGDGSFGDVFKVKHRISGETRVCKRIAKSEGMNHGQILLEIGYMAMLDHPNVIKVYEYFDDAGYVFQIMEQCEGGELQAKVDETRMTGRPSYSEAFVCDVMKQTLRALAYMHKIPILHKDLKPQNILLVDQNSWSVKVIDFGLAELFQKDQEFASSSGGTLLYMAPEVFRREMTTRVDVWSAGVILFNLLTGDFPFMEAWTEQAARDQARWQEQTMRKIMEAEAPRHGWLGAWSSSCRDLLLKMLRREVKARPDALQCLEHPWFVEFSEVPQPLSVGVVQCVEAYSRMSELKKAIFLLMVHQCALEAIPELRALFTHLDRRNQGCLDATDLHRLLVEAGMSGLRAERVVHALDRHGDGRILWSEFTAAAACVSVCRSSRPVDVAFLTIDADQDGRIGPEDLVEVIAGSDAGAQEEWRRRMPEFVEEALRAEVPGGSPHTAQDASTPGEGRLSREGFRRYLGRRLDFQGGDALVAVVSL